LFWTQALLAARTVVADSTAFLRCSLPLWAGGRRAAFFGNGGQATREGDVNARYLGLPCACVSLFLTHYYSISLVHRLSHIILWSKPSNILISSVTHITSPIIAGSSRHIAITHCAFSAYCTAHLWVDNERVAQWRVLRSSALQRRVTGIYRLNFSFCLGLVWTTND